MVVERPSRVSSTRKKKGNVVGFWMGSRKIFRDSAKPAGEFRRNPIEQHGDRGGQRGGSLGQMRSSLLSLSTLVRSSLLLSSSLSLSSTFRSEPVLFLLRRAEHMAPCVHVCTRPPGYDSRTMHAFTQPDTYTRDARTRSSRPRAITPAVAYREIQCHDVTPITHRRGLVL